MYETANTVRTGPNRRDASLRTWSTSSVAPEEAIAYWRDVVRRLCVQMGIDGINPNNLTRISFGRPDGSEFVMDSIFRDQLRGVSARSLETSATVVGRLQMGDFSPAALRCRIDTFAGSVSADFDADLRDTVLDAMDQMVMATGIAELQPDGATVRVLHISALESLPTARVSSLASLQRQQGVAEVRDIDDLRGHTEDTDDFGPFLDAIRSARHAGWGERRRQSLEEAIRRYVENFPGLSLPA